jgi:ABC-type sugar transport system ATPase subunit
VATIQNYQLSRRTFFEEARRIRFYLLCRFYDVTEGEIYVDGCPLRQLNLDSWRSRIALVSQDIHMLFSATIRENIAYGRLEATEDALGRSPSALSHRIAPKSDRLKEKILPVGRLSHLDDLRLHELGSTYQKDTEHLRELHMAVLLPDESFLLLKYKQ